LASACGGGFGAEIPTVTPALTPAPSVIPTSTVRPTEAPAATPGDFDYTVEDGDTLSAIADRFGISQDSLASTNGLTLDSLLSIGQVLRIVGSPVPRPASAVPTLDPSIEIDNPAGAGWLVPVEGACIPTDDNQMPNAPREYRNGVHEGVDFFTGFACVDVETGTPALASKAGRVIRADHIYKPLTDSELDDLLAKVEAQGFTDTATLDRFRGRQVWIDHGDGFVTRYSHLDGIPEDLLVGANVERGDLIGFIGDSGTPEAVTNPGFENHLHFELRIGSSFLGAGEPPEVVRALYADAFFGE
jgi:murein DD-endopeptidase MepM/ murein hydrolase activator NlpD